MGTKRGSIRQGDQKFRNRCVRGEYPYASWYRSLGLVWVATRLLMAVPWRSESTDTSQ